jgi:hypothetical protein
MSLSVSASAIVAADPLDADRLLNPSNSTLEERWAVWQARGAAHELAVARRARVVVPILMVLLAVAMLAMFAR